MKKSLFTILMCWSALQLSAQELVSNTGKIHLVAVEDTDVDATSESFTSKLDLDDRSVVFSIPVQSFTFASSTMQRHFNEPKAMDSKQWPKIKFKGSIGSEADLAKDGSHEVTVTGDMTIRDTTKPFSTTGTLIVKDGTWTATTTFHVDATEFGIIKYDFGHDIRINVEATYSK